MPGPSGQYGRKIGRLSVAGTDNAFVAAAASGRGCLGVGPLRHSDRVALLPMDSTKGGIAAGRKAVSNAGDEVDRQKELADVAAGVVGASDVEVHQADYIEAAAILELLT